MSNKTFIKLKRYATSRDTFKYYNVPYNSLMVTCLFDLKLIIRVETGTYRFKSKVRNSDLYEAIEKCRDKSYLQVYNYVVRNNIDRKD